MRRNRGFTLIELMVVVGIVMVLAALAYAGLERYRPRANFDSATAELRSMLQLARQTALASGDDVGVAIFADQATPEGTGRVLVYRDSARDMFPAGRLSGAFFSYTPTPATPLGGAGEIVASLDLPRGVTFGPADGGGVALVPPLDTIATDSACTFCASGTDRRGVIRFDVRGTATFFGSEDEDPVPVGSGASLAIQCLELQTQMTYVVTSSAGTVFTVKN